jgi:hypothetical protein
MTEGIPQPPNPPKAGGQAFGNVAPDSDLLKAMQGTFQSLLKASSNASEILLDCVLDPLSGDDADFHKNSAKRWQKLVANMDIYLQDLRSAWTPGMARSGPIGQPEHRDTAVTVLCAGGAGSAQKWVTPATFLTAPLTLTCTLNGVTFDPATITAKGSTLVRIKVDDVNLLKGASEGTYGLTDAKGTADALGPIAVTVY